MMKNSLDTLKFRLTQYLLDSGVFLEEPMRIADVGVRGGPEPCWDIYGNQLHLIGFEPDVEECKRLNRLAKNKPPLGRKEEYYSIALYRDKGTYTLHISKNKEASSLFQTNRDFVSRFPHESPGAIIASAQVQTTDIDAFLKENGIDYVDFMKIDVEGAELAVLEGAGNLLSESLLGLSIEVFFQPYHIGRPLFGDIDKYLRGLGFMFFDFPYEERWRRKTLADNDPITWYGTGQLIWAQALYFYDFPTRMKKGADCGLRRIDRLKVLKSASLAEVFGFPDFAVELLQNAKSIGLLNEEEVRLMVGLLPPLLKPGNVRYIRAFKQVARRFIPSFWRRGLRRLLKDISSS